MEVTKINILTDFEAGINCLQYPSLITRFFPLSAIQKVPQLQVYNFWKWGALIFVIFATFSTLINKIKLLIIRVRTFKSSASSAQPLLQKPNDEFEFSDDDTSSFGSESDDEEIESTSSFEDRKPVDEDFRVAGRLQKCNLKLRRRPSGCDLFSLSDFAAGDRIVKLWESFGVGLDIKDSFGGEISIWDVARDQKIRSYFGGRCQILAVAMFPPAVVLLAEVNSNDNVVLGAYDTRVGRQNQAICAEWQPPVGNVVGINSGGVGKVYVRDGVTGGIVGDIRNVKSPLENLTESDFDPDGVIVEDEFRDEL